MSEPTAPPGGDGETTTPAQTEHHALLVDADGACEFLASHPGWAIFPGRMVWDSGRWSKLPAEGLPWAKESSDDPAIVRGLWSMYANPKDGKAYIAVHVGKSGLVVLDTDTELEDEAWKAVLDETQTLVLRSCTREMPHYVFAQPSDHDVVVIQNWPGGEVKSQNGYIFVSSLPPLSGVIPLKMPQKIVDMLRTAAVVDDDFATVKMSDRDLEVWLSETESRIGGGEDALIDELVKTMNRLADEGHRRDAMRATCMTLAIEATAGLYGARKAWDAVEEAYKDLRDDPGRNGKSTGKEWGPHWWQDSRTLLAGAVEKVEAGRFDEAIQEKRERFSIWSDEEVADWTDFFERAALKTDPEDAPVPLRESFVETDDDRPTPPAARAENATETPVATPQVTPDPAPTPAPDKAPTEPPSPLLNDGAGIDPHAKLRDEVRKRGADLDLVKDFATSYHPQTRQFELEAKLGAEVQKQLDRNLVREIVKSIDDEPILPKPWDWLVEGGIDAVVEKSPGTLLKRADGIGVLYDRGVVHWIGDKSTGKSWLCAHLCLELIREGKTVAWFDYETDEQQVAERFLQAGATVAQIVDQLHYFSMKGQAIAGAVQTVSQITPLPAVLVVDSVDASMAASGAEDENSSSSYHTWRNTVAPLTEIMLVSLIEHTGHDNAHRARGAAAKGQQADMEFSAKVIKPFSKVEAGLVEWTCRKMRRGSVFTTDEVACMVRISPNGMVKDHEGKNTRLESAVRIEILAPNDTKVVSTALEQAVDNAINAKAEVLVALRDAGAPRTVTDLDEQLHHLNRQDIKEAVLDLAANGFVSSFQEGTKTMFSYTGG